MEDHTPWEINFRHRNEKWQNEETRTSDLQIQKPQQQQGKIPSMIFKGVVLALAVALLPWLHKQSPHFMSGYANQGRSWEHIIFVIIGFVVSCGVMSRRPGKGKDGNDDGGEGAQNYVHKIFEIADVFNDFKTPASDEGVRDKLEMWSSKWQPEEPFVFINGERKKDARAQNRFPGEKPLLLPVRSLSSSLSNLDEFLDTASSNTESAQEGRKDVRNSQILSVESGNFEEEVEHVVTNGAPVVLPSPIPWASRPDVLTAKESHPPIPVPPPAPAADALASIDEKIKHADDPPAIPSPIPWRSRPSDDAKQRNGTENPDVSEGKPPLVPLQRSPANKGVSVPPSPSPRSSPRPSPSPPPRAVPSSPSPSPSPRPSPSPPRPSSRGVSNGNPYKNLQTPHAGLQKLSSPRPSPSPPRPRNALAENGSSRKREPPIDAGPTTHNGPALSNTKETPTPPPPPPPPATKENGFTGSSRKLHVNGDGPRHRSSTDVPNSASPDETKSRQAPVISPGASPLPPPPPPPPPFEDLPAPKKSLENGLVYRSDSRSKSREGLSQRSVSNTIAREGSSNRSDSRSKDRERSSNRSDSRGKCREGSSNRSDSRSRSREASFHSQHTSRDMETDSGSTRQKIRDGDASRRVEFEKSSRKSTSPHPPAPPPPPRHVLYPDEPKPDHIPPPSLSPKDEEPNDDLKSEKTTYSSAKVLFEVGNSESESDSGSLTDTDEEDNSSSSPDEVDRKADEFIAKFHEQMRLQRVQSIRRTQRRLAKKSG